MAQVRSVWHAGLQSLQYTQELADRSVLYALPNMRHALQVGYGFSRRLAQSGFSSDKVAIWVSVKFTGTTEPVLTAVNNLKADPCKIHGFCTAMDAVKVVHITGGQINSTNLVVKVDSYTPGSLTFKAAFIENGIEVTDTPFLLRTNRSETNRGKLGACTSESAIDGKARLWKCEVYIPVGDTIALSVTVPNTQDPANPITKTLDVSPPGEANLEALTSTATASSTQVTFGVYKAHYVTFSHGMSLLNYVLCIGYRL